MFESNQGSNAELNPRPIRVIATMGDVTIRDWFIFFIACIFAAPFLIFCVPSAFGLQKVIDDNSI